MVVGKNSVRRALDQPHPPPPGTCAHRVQFYEDDAFLVASAARLIGGALGSGDVAVSIATAPHREGIEDYLRGCGLDLATAAAQHRYIALDAEETLASFMVDGWPDKSRFEASVGAVMARGAAQSGASVCAFGEMVALLAAAGNHDAAVKLEDLWNDLAKAIPFSLLCAYPMRVFRTEAATAPFAKVMAAHSHVTPAESYSTLGSEEERLRLISRLQQQAALLDTLAADRRELQETRARYAAIVESSDDAIVGKTLEGIVTTWNPGAERLFGYTADEMIGQPISRLMPPERLDDSSKILNAIRDGKRIEHFETYRIRKDGKRIDVSLTVSPIKDATGRIIGASKIARDVTDRKRADAHREEMLAIAERARHEAQAANRAKDEFLAMLGHELRNPLAAMRNAIAAAHVDGSRRERALEIARRQAEHLARLVDDLLDVARITQGKITLRTQPVHVATIVERAVDASKALIEERAHGLTVSLPAGDVEVEGDATRLEQVIVNLLTNAAKYTPPRGRIEIVADREGMELVLRVRDNGIGIAPAMLSRVFDLFAQGDRALERAPGGLGIGLTLVRKLVELHGGRVMVHSSGVGEGAEFVVRLPALPPSVPRVADATAPNTDRGAARVLVVEDHPDIAESLSMLLEVLGHRVCVVHDGEEALTAAQKDPPDVMLVDIGLPGIDGYEVARRIRQSPAMRQVVLVALTGYGRDEDRERARMAGFDHHLAKPVEPDALHALVTRIAGGDVERESSTLH
jgi:PAS domain S-box-containing protein